MGIQEEIFEEFFVKLIESGKVPQITISELKKLYEGKGAISQDKVFDAIKKGFENVGENKKD